MVTDQQCRRLAHGFFGLRRSRPKLPETKQQRVDITFIKLGPSRGGPLLGLRTSRFIDKLAQVGEMFDGRDRDPLSRSGTPSVASRIASRPLTFTRSRQWGRGCWACLAVCLPAPSVSRSFPADTKTDSTTSDLVTGELALRRHLPVSTY